MYELNKQEDTTIKHPAQFNIVILFYLCCYYLLRSLHDDGTQWALYTLSGKLLIFYKILSSSFRREIHVLKPQM